MGNITKIKKTVISIIIVNYNGKCFLKTIFDSINKSFFRDYEIIVVDNNSTDGSQEFIKKNYKNAKIVQNKENLGYVGINSGIKYCKGKYIFFTNNDVSLGKNCIKRLVDVLEQDKSIGIASPKVVNYFNKSLKSCGTWVSRSFYNGHFKCNRDFKKEIPYNGVALIRKKIVDKFGYLFDKDYFIYAEDLDLGLRTRLLGYNVAHIPEAVIYHMHSVTAGKNKKYKLTYMMERNLLSTFIKIMSIKNIILFFPYVTAMRLMAIAKDILTLKFANAVARIMAILTVIFGLYPIIGKRAVIQRLRRADDSFLLQVFSERHLFGSQKIKV